jgi:hypothetical protein
LPVADANHPTVAEGGEVRGKDDGWVGRVQEEEARAHAIVPNPRVWLSSMRKKYAWSTGSNLSEGIRWSDTAMRGTLVSDRSRAGRHSLVVDISQHLPLGLFHSSTKMDPTRVVIGTGTLASGP